MKTGLFFGSFNPIHIGHLIIANTMTELSDLSEVWFVVSPQNPLKKQKNLLHEFDRLDMVEKAIADNHKLKTSDIEFHLPRPSYTIDTLTHLQEKFPKKEFAIIMGSDNLVNLKKWKNYEQILEYYSLYVYPRPNESTKEFDQNPKIHFISSPMMDISATFIRNCIKDKKSIKYLVPESVENYIQQKGFYL